MTCLLCGTFLGGTPQAPYHNGSEDCIRALASRVAELEKNDKATTSSHVMTVSSGEHWITCDRHGDGVKIYHKAAETCSLCTGNVPS